MNPITFEELVKEARRLSLADRRKLVDAVEQSMAEQASCASGQGEPGPYARTLAMAGVGHTDFTDVSTDKYKHLGEVYGDNHESE